MTPRHTMTLTVVRPGEPAFGGDPGTPEADRAIAGWTVYPTGSSEITDHADQVSADLTAVRIGEADVDIQATDQVRDPYDSERLLSVVGEPRRYKSSLSGNEVCEIRLRRNSG